MPIDYQLDLTRRLVLTRAWGVLTDADILGHKDRLLADPLYDPTMGELSDIRAIERLDVTEAGVQAMTRHDRTHATKLAGRRLAIVLSLDVAFGMARMYELIGGSDPGGVAVFRSLEEAEAWLEGRGEAPTPEAPKPE